MRPSSDNRTFSKLRQNPEGVINGSSMRAADNWWYRSHLGCWDHPTFSPKIFHNRHIAAFAQMESTDFHRLDLGWWNIRSANALARGYFPDEAEYFGCKAAAHDASVTVIGTSGITDGPLKFSADMQLTISGWWENLRYVRAYTPGLQERMRAPQVDFRLRQDGSGAWRVTPYETRKHAVPTADFAAWRETFGTARPAEIRVEALYDADHKADGAETVRILDTTTLAAYEKATAEGMSLTVAKDRDKTVGETVKMTASNSSAPQKRSWVRIRRTIPVERMLKPKDVTTLWVKGDGSGAIVNFQLESAKEFGHAFSENFVVLDFTGWRRVDLLLREPDLVKSDDYEWPYDFRLMRRTPAHLFRTGVRNRPLSAVAVYVANVAPGKSATVEFGAWDSIPMKKGTLDANSVVALNGRDFTLPFALPGGDYAELADGAWTHYSELGEPLERVAASAVPAVKPGANELAFAGQGPDGFPRVEVTLFAMGESEPATGVLTDAQKRELAVEYELPQLFNPPKGLSVDCDVKVRPGETAKLGFEILGPAKNPTINGQILPITLETEADKVISEDGEHWKAVRVVAGETGDENRKRVSQRMPLGQGTLAEPFVLGGGTAHVTYASEVLGSRVTFVKYYRSSNERKIW